MRVVLTGASGRLARATLPKLLADAQVEAVIGIDRAPPVVSHPRYRHLQCDILEADMTPAMAGAQVLVHMAFVLMGGGLGRARHDRAAVRRVNVEGSRRVFEAAYAAGLRRLIFLSSAAVYGAWPDNPPTLTETAPLRPNPGFAYAEDKAAVEAWLEDFAAAHPDCAVLRLRPHAILGPNAHPLLRLLLRQPFVPYTPARAPLTQCVWEDDVAEAVRLALTRGGPGAYNLAAQPPVSLRRMLARRRRLILPVPPTLACALHRLAWWLTPAAGEPGWVRGTAHHLALDTRRARQELGWRPALDTWECIDRS